MDMTDIRLSNPKPLFNRAKKAEVGFVAVKVFRDENTCEMGFEASEIRVSTELWIGNNDFLIHKTSVRYFEKVDENFSQNDEVIDQAAKKTLEMQSKPVTPEAIAALRPQMREMRKQVQPILKSAFKEGILYTQTHENISINQSYAPRDFLPSKD